MKKILFKNAEIYRNNHFEQGDILCINGKITEIAEQIACPEAMIFDCGGKRLVPGFIDIHTHGAAGVDVNAATADELNRISTFFAAQGTTSWLASVLTDTEKQTLWCIEQIKHAMQHNCGAALLGVHLEGPFLATEFKGAMPEHLLKKGDKTLFDRYQKAAGGAIKYITVSPEVSGIPELIKEISDDVVIAIGHSGADYETSMQCIANGARCVTHTFNAMKLLHQHFPAIMGAALESDTFCEAICDGRHLHPGTVRVLLKAKGWDRVVAVTDSIMAAGLPDGNYKLGVNDVTVQAGDAKLTSNGVRAGSTLTTGKALKNLVEFTGKGVEDVLPLLTLNPARALRIADRKGSIEIGKDADMVLLEDDLSVVATVVAGACVWNADADAR